MNDQGSKAFALNTTDLIVVGKNALLVGLAAVLTYVGENLTKIDLGSMSALIVPVVVVVINTVVKWAKDNTKDK
jgi:uncharacterized membrane protein AbrB (regulator of aidB expression)